ncbi:hypothetical protein Q5425_10415 [Amycolatopsis sp. A133]|uniref:hypothetical protein n=1 Tax=Amycolatopsis sp. A133 TaxID=3064472 RepID=UPI0027EA7AFC|nr:hypothetical protein [Amycolatopsis sp. A133]MDQ7804147.1 hypothetical protein [Amycolatopsis sp. A133]
MGGWVPDARWSPDRPRACGSGGAGRRRRVGLAAAGGAALAAGRAGLGGELGWAGGGSSRPGSPPALLAT